MEDDGALFCEDGPTAKRPKLARKGGVLFRSMDIAKPKGPESFQELMQWPKSHVQTIARDEEMKQRLIKVMRKGIRMQTAFSGMDAPREAMRQIAQGMRCAFDFRPQIEYTHSCDNAELPQKVLTWLAKEEDAGQSCVFSDLEDRLPDDAKFALQNLAPDPDSNKLEKAAAYTRIWEYLHDNRQACFNQFSTCFCLVHQKHCRINPGAIQDPDSQSQDPFQSSPGTTTVPTGPWQPFNLNVAGTVCKGWSFAGSKAQFSHPSERPHAVWLAERKARAEQLLEDAFVQECTVGYPVDEKLRGPLEDTHEIVMVKTGPEKQGWPITRPRSFTFGINKKRWVWVGPSTDMAIQEDFDNLFGKSVELTGDVFFQASTCQIRQHVFAQLKKRGRAADVGQALEIDHSLLLAMLSPGAAQRLEQYEKVIEKKGGIESGAFLCDCDQWPETGCSTCGPWFPCQLTHANVISMNMLRPAVGFEYLAGQGFHVFQGANVLPAAISPLMESWPTEKIVSLSGNSMSLPAISAWFLYVLSNIEPVVQLRVMPELNMLQKGNSGEFTPRKQFGVKDGSGQDETPPH